MTIRPITSDDLPAVAALHLACLPNTTSSKIGEEYLLLLYKGLLALPGHILLCAEEKKRIVGVISVTENLGRTSESMTSFLYPKALPALMRAVVNGRITPIDIVKQLLFERALLKRFGSPYSTILTLFVAPAFQRKGVGRKLIQQVHNKKMLYVDTRIVNTKAQAFYSRVGGREVGRIHNAVVYRFN